MAKAYIFDINHPGEYAAGIIGFSDEVTISVDSGDPGGEDGEFEEYMRQCLAEWYDGASVLNEEDAKKQYDLEQKLLEGAP